ncbi:MAG: acyltransferase [Pseudomonadota bacterium]
MTGVSRHSYPVLDGMRGVAAIGVLVYHFKDLLPFPIFKAGYLAVDLFFCLSGFVIAHAYEGKLLTGMTFRHFARLRIVRLWPLVALGLIVGVAQILLLSGTADPVMLGIAALFNILLLPNFVGPGPQMFSANPPHWSLFYELAVNLAYAGLVRLLSNRVLVVLILIGFAVLAVGAATFGTANLGWARDQLPFGAGRVTCGFLSGVLLYRLRDRIGQPRWRDQAWLPLLLTALVLTLPVTRTVRPAFDCLFVLLGAPLLVWIGANCRPEPRALPLMRGLGSLSYPLYALHFPIYLIAADLAARAPGAAAPIAIGAMLLACAGSLVAARFYDEPLRRWLSGRAGLRR